MQFEQNGIWQALILLWRSAQQEKGHLIRGTLWLILAAGTEMAGPILGKMFIDDHLSIRNLDWNRMALILIGILLSGWLASLLRYLQLVRLSGLAMRSVGRLRERAYTHVMRLPMTFFDTSITGQLVSRVTNDTEAVKNLYIQVLFVLLNSGIILLAAMVAMTLLDWRLMLFVASMIPVVIAMVWLYQYLSAPAVSNSRKLRSDINAQMAESLGGMGILQALNAVKQFKDLFRSTNHAHYLARVQVQNANAWLLRPALDLLNIVLLILVIFSFSKRPLNGLEVGLLYAFVSYIGHIIDPLIQITTQFGQLQQSVVAAARVHQLLEEKATRPIENAAVVTNGSISIRHLKFGYAPDNLVIQDVSLEIPSGSFIGIAGKTGSGKSTLLNILLRFYSPQSGHVEFGGARLESINEATFRTHVGLVPQDPFLMAATVRENISMGRDISDQEIEKAGRASKAHKFISALEKGYDTPLGEGGSRLSTGQKQLIAIARALAGQPKILFLDEATSHIDSETSKSIQSALHELHGKVTIVAIAHRLSTIRHADNIVIINHGTIAETGTHENLMHHADGIYRKLYLLQQMGE